MENYKPKEDSQLVKLTRMWIKALICVLVTLILTLGIYHGYRTYRIGQAIEKGYNPIIARLAFTHGRYERYERLVYLSGNKNIQCQQNLVETKKE